MFKKGLVSTERGSIWLEEEFKTVDEARNAGYNYMFYSRELRAELYGRRTGQYSIKFATIID